MCTSNISKHFSLFPFPSASDFSIVFAFFINCLLTLLVLSARTQPMLLENGTCFTFCSQKADATVSSSLFV
jgi:hypothetical protein